MIVDVTTLSLPMNFVVVDGTTLPVPAPLPK
jgi:hypothetical protein